MIQAFRKHCIEMVNPKIFSSFLVIWIAVINYLSGNIFVSSVMICAEKIFFKLLLFPSLLAFTIQFNVRFILIKSQTKLCGIGPNRLLPTSFTDQQINHVYTVAIKTEVYVIHFFCHSTLKFIAQT